MHNYKFLFVKSIALAVTILGLLNLSCRAADSLWLLCDNGNLAMNLLEHRSADGQGRITSLMLLLGANAFSGQLTDTNSGKVFLDSSPKGKNKFNGSVAINYSKKVVSLNGTLSLGGDRFNINTRLQCKELRSNL
jgi:hypothetical protein